MSQFILPPDAVELATRVTWLDTAKVIQSATPYERTLGSLYRQILYIKCSILYDLYVVFHKILLDLVFKK